LPSKAFTAAPSSPASSWLSAYFNVHALFDKALRLVEGFTASVAVWFVPLKVAVMATEVEDDTVKVVTINAAVVLVAATVTDEGTVAADVLPLDRDIVAPPVGAALPSVIVP
jgi:hypothetical protein